MNSPAAPRLLIEVPRRIGAVGGEQFAEHEVRVGDHHRRFPAKVLREAPANHGVLRLHPRGRPDIAQLQHKLREAPYHANRVLALLSKMMNLAEPWGLRQDGTNPCRHVQNFKEELRERFLSERELARLQAVLAKAEEAKLLCMRGDHRGDA